VHKFLQLQKMKSLPVKAGAFLVPFNSVAFKVIVRETVLETWKEDAAVSVVRFQMVVQAGLLP